MTAAFNVFQKLFQSWEAVHPYNAAQMVRWRDEVEPAHAQRSWESALSAMGLGRVRVFEGREIRHESLNGEMSRYPLRVLAEQTDFPSYLSDELNRPFDDPAEPPFRPFLFRQSSGTWLGIVYRHWVADSVSIRALLGEWCDRICPQSAGPKPATKLTAPPYWDLFGQARDVRVDHTVLGLWRSHQRLRTALKISRVGPEDYPVRVTLRNAPQGLIGAIRTYARRKSVSVGDVLLAALVDATAEHIPMQIRPNRRDVAVGNVVDLRPHSKRDLAGTFGLFLGFSHVVCRPADLRDWDRLLAAVHLQARARRQNVAQASTAWSAAALAVQRLVPNNELYHFYRKEIPLAAGLSNVNLAKTWVDARHPGMALEYLRISPTGPTAPAVLSATTLGDGLSLALTHRAKFLDQSKIHAMIQHFLDRLADESGFPR